MRYYLYISKAKLDMLYQQIQTPQKRKASLEWKFEAKLPLVASGSLSRKVETDDDVTTEEMLKAVIKKIEDSGEVGTADDPKTYVKGTLPMRWGLFNDLGRPQEEPPLVYFGGKTEQTVFGLGGSSRHVISVCGASNTSSRSATPELVAHLLRGLEMPFEGWRVNKHSDPFEAIAWATHNLKPPDVTLEFLARTLLAGETALSPFARGRTMRALLGTPLYVALVGPSPRDLEQKR